VESVIDDAFRSHRAEIYRYLRRRTKSRDHAEELTQQAFADAVIAISRMDAGPCSMLGLLYTIARRRFADDVRRSGPCAEHARLEDVAEELAAPDGRNELAHGIRDALARLPDEQRRAVWLKLIYGCSFAEVACLLGGSEAAAKMRFHRALVALRRDLERDGIHPDCLSSRRSTGKRSANSERINAMIDRADA
jgi:RNA polymerase sigma factor (sigma-70 family)